MAQLAGQPLAGHLFAFAAPEAGRAQWQVRLIAGGEHDGHHLRRLDATRLRLWLLDHPEPHEGNCRPRAKPA